MKRLDKILETLIINGTLTEQPGLFYGKTGVAVFFFHYARLTGNSVFQDYAMSLIEELQEQTSNATSVRYDIGLAGIGVGFNYFLQNGFIAADDDLFEEFDARMYRAVLYEPYTDLSLEEGLTGLGRYFIYRLQGNGNKDDKLNKGLTHIAHEIARRIKKKTVKANEQPDVFRFLLDLGNLPEYAAKNAVPLQQCWEWKCICEPDIQKIFPYMNTLQRLHVCQRYFNKNLTEEIRQEWERRDESDDKSLINMGLLNGWANEGMLFLTFFNNLDKSWFNLL